MAKVATKLRNDSRRNGKAWAKRTGNTPPKVHTEEEEVRAAAKVWSRGTKDKQGSNLTAPKINWGWFALAMRTTWRFEGQGSRKARTMDAILAGSHQADIEKAKESEKVQESVRIATPKKRSRKGGSS